MAAAVYMCRHFSARYAVLKPTFSAHLRATRRSLRGGAGGRKPCLYLQTLRENCRLGCVDFKQYSHRCIQRRTYSALLVNTCDRDLYSGCRYPSVVRPGRDCRDRGRYQFVLPTCSAQWARPFRTTPRAYIPPFLWLIVQPVAKVTAILTGRVFRKWHKTLPDHKKIISWANLKAHWYWLVLGGVTFSGLMYAYYQSHLQETPVTSRVRFIVVTDEQFIKIAEHEAEMFVKKYSDITLPTSHPYYKTVVEITRRLVSSNQDFPRIKEHTWSVHVVDSPERNAFVLPTGHIFVFTGLIKTTDNEDQLAAVIGHELAHALLSHAAEQLSFAQLVDWMIIAVMAAIWAVMPTDGIAVITQWFYNKVVQFSLHLPYSRKLESEADKVGLMLCAKACFDVRESSAFWTIMDCLSRLEGEKVPEWLSTHPANDTRVKHLDFIMPKVIEQRAACSCPELPALDPRMRVQPFKKKADSVVRALQAGVNLQQVNVIKPRASQSA